jgi:hypothetical protein
MAFSGPFAFTLAFIVFSLGFSLSLGVLTLLFNAKRYYFSRQLVLDGAAWLTIAYVLNVMYVAI